MLHDHKDSLTKDEQTSVCVFMTSLKLCGHRCIPPNAAHKQDLLRAIKEVKKNKIWCFLVKPALTQVTQRKERVCLQVLKDLSMQEKFKYEAEEKTSKVAWEKKMVNSQRK